MSAAERVSDLTVLLTRLAAATPPVEPTRLGVDAALHGRAATHALVQQVMHDITGAAIRRRPDIVDLQERPAAVLVWSLRQQPRIYASQSPTDVALAARPGSTSALWERAGAIAADAHLQWTSSAARPTGAAARSAVADLAVTTMALAGLDRSLAKAAQFVGASEVLEVLRAPEASGLRLAAEATLRQSAGEEFPRWDARSSVDSRRLPVLPVTGLSQVPRGLARLSQLLQSNIAVSPGDTAILLTAQARISADLATRTARRAQATREPDVAHLAGVLTDHTRALAGAWSRADNHLASLTSSDPRPVQQAGECLRGLRASQQAALPAAFLREVAAQLLEVAPATSRCAERQVRAASWITSAAREDSVAVARTWQVATMAPPPYVVASLGALQSSAVRAAQTLVGLGTSPAAAVSHARMSHTRTVFRPALPAATTPRQR